MKKTTVILLACLAGAAHSQTLVPGPKPGGLPESLLETEETGGGEETGKSGPVQTAEPGETGAAQPAGEDPGKRPDIQPTPDEGISIQVEKTAHAPDSADAEAAKGEVKVYSPWPAKPMFPAPEGWKFAPAPEGMEPYRTKVKLGTGQEVGLAITPFVLVPVTDGLNSIRITEPGYRPELGYVQRDTIGVMLQKSNADLEQNEQQAAESIRRLQQLLSSLPKPGSSPLPPPAPSQADAPNQAKP